jgi:hypothetical protein
MRTWQLQEAEAKSVEAIDEADRDASQKTSHNIDLTQAVPMQEWNKFEPGSNEGLFAVLQAGSHFDIPIPPRGRHKRRKPIEF